MSRPHIVVGVIGRALLSFAGASMQVVQRMQALDAALAQTHTWPIDLPTPASPIRPSTPPKDRRPYYRQFEKRRR